MKTGSIRLCAVVAAVILATSACGAFDEEPETAGATGGVIKLGLPTGVTSFANSDVAVAKEKGFFDELGLTVEWQNLRSGVSVVQGVAGGSLDIGAASIEPVVNAYARGGGVKIIGSYTDLLAVSAVTPRDITEPADLRGKNLGIQEVGAFREIMTRIVLESGGLAPGDVNYIPVTSQSYVSSLIQGRIQSAILQTEQAISAQREDPDLHVLVNLSETKPDYHYGTYVVSPSWLESNREDAIKFLTAITKAHRFMYENKAETLPIVSRSTGFDEDIIADSYDIMLTELGVFPVNDGLNEERLQQTIATMRQMGVLTGPNVEIAGLVERGPIDEVVQELGRWEGDDRWR